MYYARPWENEKLTNRIIKEFVKRRYFELTLKEVSESEMILVESADSGSENGETMTIEYEVEELCKMGIDITEEDLTRLKGMGYRKKYYTVGGFIRKYKENKEKLEDEIKEILDDWLRDLGNQMENKVQGLIRERDRLGAIASETEIRTLVR